MAIKGQKPILIAGLGLCGLLWLGQSLQAEFLTLSQWGLWGLTLGGFILWRCKRTPLRKPSQPLSPLDRSTVETAIATTQTWLTEIGQAYPDLDLADVKQTLEALPQNFARQTLTVGITGGKRTGKSVLKDLLSQHAWEKPITWLETDPLFTETEITPNFNQFVDLDLILFLTNGDLTDRQWQTLRQFQSQYHRCCLLFNKQDQYRPEERTEILQHLRHQVKDYLPSETVWAIAASPQAIAVRQHQADGSIQENWEQPPAQLGNFPDELKTLLDNEQETLVLGTLWRQTQQLKTTAQERLNQVRRDRALPIIEQYQWLAAGAAFINPVASLDLLATAAINGQMVLDLGKIYQQKLSLSQAQSVAVILGELMLKLGLVELSSQAVSGFLKTQPLTYLAGGALQGVSAAYLTRIAGLGLVEYLQEQEINLQNKTPFNQERLGQKLTQIFEQSQRFNFLPQFVRQAVAQLTPLGQGVTSALQ